MESEEEEIADAIAPDEPEPDEPEPDEPPPEPVVKSRAKKDKKVICEPPEPKTRAKKDDKVICEGCSRSMTANTLRYRHKCKPKPPTEPPVEAPRVREPKAKAKKKPRQPSPATPRTVLRNMYRQVRVDQLEQKAARFRSWLD